MTRSPSVFRAAPTGLSGDAPNGRTPLGETALPNTKRRTSAFRRQISPSHATNSREGAMAKLLILVADTAVSAIESVLMEAGWATNVIGSVPPPGRLPISNIDGDGKVVLLATTKLSAVPNRVSALRSRSDSADLGIIVAAPPPQDSACRAVLLRALEAGADDFVTTTELRSELLLRVHAVMRQGRRRRTSTRTDQRFGGLTLDRDTRTLRYGDRTVAPTACEYRLFACLASRGGKAVPRAILGRCLAEHSRMSGNNALEVYVVYLRRKLKALGATCRIRTVRGVGYELTLAAAPVDVRASERSATGRRTGGHGHAERHLRWNDDWSAPSRSVD